MRAWTIAVLVLATACGDGAASDDAPDAAVVPEADAAVDAMAVPEPVTVSRVLPWLGGGVQIVVELPAELGGPGAWPEAWVETAADAHVDASVEPAGVVDGLTAIVIVPSTDAGIHAARLATAEAVLDALPVAEEVAVLVARDAAVLVAELSTDRAHASAQLAALSAGPSTGAGAMMDGVRTAVADLESRFAAPGRSVIVIGEAVAEPAAEIVRKVQTLSLATVADPDTDAAALVGSLHQRRATLIRVGACANLAADEPFVLHLGPTVTPLDGPEPLVAMAGLPCEPHAAALDAFPFPDEIDLTFTAEERTIYDARVVDRSEEPFRTSITFGVGAAITADAHLRGQGTLNCERKSYSVTLDGARQRLTPGLATDRFFLISMCQDRRYFGQVFGDRLLAGMGLFPARLRYVKVRIDGVNAGVYMLVHSPERALRDRSLGLASVVRRRVDVFGQPAEVKYPGDPILAEEERLRFEALGDLALNGPAETLEAELDARLELDRYLEMVATFSLLQNGDFVDEAFFASSLEDGSPRYRVTGWDTDDLWEDCHYGGEHAIVDACGVTYCAEAELDHALLRSPAVYRRYLDALAVVMARLTPTLLQTTMDQVQADLWRVLDDDETAAALTELVTENPAASTRDGARADIASSMSWALTTIEDRRAALADALAACPAAQ